MRYFLQGKYIDENKDPEFFKEFWAKQEKDLYENIHKGRLGATLKMIDRKPKKILDVGCHVGLLDKYFGEMGHRVVGVDILGDAIEIAKKFFSNANTEYICGDIFKIGFEPETFDLILFLETIEHVENPTAFLKRFHELLKPGGELIVSTPDSIGITNILYNLKHSFDFVNKVDKEPLNTGTEMDHINSFDKICLYRLLNRNGFNYVEHKILSKFRVNTYQTMILKVQKRADL